MSIEYVNDEDVAGKLYSPAFCLYQTASGYGKKIRTAYKLVFKDGSKRRVYATVYSNAGSAWIIRNKRQVHLNDTLLSSIPTIQ